MEGGRADSANRIHSLPAIFGRESIVLAADSCYALQRAGDKHHQSWKQKPRTQSGDYYYSLFPQINRQQKKWERIVVLAAGAIWAGGGAGMSTYRFQLNENEGKFQASAVL